MENEKLFRLLTGKNPLDLELIIKLDGKVNRDYYHKDQIILIPGEIPEFIWYIEKGSAIGYFYRDDKKIILFIRHEGSLMIPINSFFSQEVSKIYIQLREPSVLRSISFDHFEDLKNTYPGTSDCITRIIKEHNELAEGEGIEESEMFKNNRIDIAMDELVPAPIDSRSSAISISNYLGISIKKLYKMRSRNKNKE